MGTNTQIRAAVKETDDVAQPDQSPRSDPTRLFVRGLPPSFTDAEFRSLFVDRKYDVTDTKFFPHRRFGYVGFRNAQDAMAARKWFDKSFVRMSKIAVEFAREYNAQEFKSARPATRKPEVQNGIQNGERQSISLKRKRGEDKQRSDERAFMPKDNSDLNEKAETVEIANKQTSTDENEDFRTQQNGFSSDALTENEKWETREQTTDADWMRSRTSRLLGLIDESEEDESGDQELQTKTDAPSDDAQYTPHGLPDGEIPTHEDEPTKNGNANSEEVYDANIDAIRVSSRLFLRNLPYTIEEAEVEEYFSPIGAISEVHLPLDPKTRRSKGFGYVQFDNPEDAIAAYRKFDGVVFKGRLLHVLPGSAKRETKLDEFAISKLPLKKQREIRRKSEATIKNFNWNSLYMNADAVASSAADRLGISKSELFDPSSSDAAVKQAQVETHIIQETKKFFEQHGVDLNSFNRRDRSDTAILVKNFPYGTKADDLQKLFSEYGDVSRVLLPPSGTIAIVEYNLKTQARVGFTALAYRKYGDSVLFLEKAPKGVFKGAETESHSVLGGPLGNAKLATTDLLEQGDEQEGGNTGTLFARNLNFTTTNQRLIEAFRAFDGFLSAQVKMKPDPKNKGQSLSMGFGFIEFRNGDQARAALHAMNGYSLDGHQLVLKISHRGHDMAEQERREDKAKRLKARQSKLVIKNLPFEATKKDVQTLFRSYGQLRAVRVPKKFDNSRKGFAFAEFATPKEAANAMDALRNTHLLGRRLVLDFASGDAEDPEEEIEKMQKKVDKQSQSLRMQQLTSGRKKFVVDEEGGADG